MEDKIGLKRNSFSKIKKIQPRFNKKFCNKINITAKSRRFQDFMIVARIESFILNKGLKDALKEPRHTLRQVLMLY